MKHCSIQFLNEVISTMNIYADVNYGGRVSEGLGIAIDPAMMPNSAAPVGV